MTLKTRLFGEINIVDEKIITMDKGMIGFSELKKFALIFDEEKKDKKFKIMWLQSLDDGDIAFPVTDPISIKEDYSPSVNEELVVPLGKMNDEDIYLLTTVTVPKRVEDFSINLKAPIIINMATNKGMQILLDDGYPVKYKVYDIIKGAEAGE